MSGNGQRAAQGGGGFDLEMGAESVKDPSDYLQRRRIQSILDRREAVIEAKNQAMDMLTQGAIDRDLYDRRIWHAVHDFLLESRPRITRSMWFWGGIPPTGDGRLPDIWRDDIDVREMDVLPPDFDPAEVDLAESNIVLDDRGRPLHGIQPNVLGWVQLPEEENDDDGGNHLLENARRMLGGESSDDGPQVMPIVGLEDWVGFGAENHLTRQETRSHPQKMRETVKETVRLTMPADISLTAYEQIIDFWSAQGLDAEFDSGEDVIRDFDASRPGAESHTGPRTRR